MENVGQKLQDLREKTPLPRPKVAKALGMPTTSYQHYEDRYKKPLLPVDLVTKLAPMFAEHGIDPDEVLALGGVTRETAPLNRKLMRDVIEGIYAFSREQKIDLAPAPFAEIVVELYMEVSQVEVDQQAATLKHTIGPVVRLENRTRAEEPTDPK